LSDNYARCPQPALVYRRRSATFFSKRTQLAGGQSGVRGLFRGLSLLLKRFGDFAAGCFRRRLPCASFICDTPSGRSDRIEILTQARIDRSARPAERQGENERRSVRRLMLMYRSPTRSRDTPTAPYHHVGLRDRRTWACLGNRGHPRRHFQPAKIRSGWFFEQRRDFSQVVNSGHITKFHAIILQALEALSRGKSAEQNCRSQRIDQEMKVERALHLSPPVGPSIDCASKARTIRS
jgi:hypothetical protein